MFNPLIESLWEALRIPSSKIFQGFRGRWLSMSWSSSWKHHTCPVCLIKGSDGQSSNSHARTPPAPAGLSLNPAIFPKTSWSLSAGCRSGAHAAWRRNICGDTPNPHSTSPSGSNKALETCTASQFYFFTSWQGNTSQISSCGILI